jgi:hypothetical protein
MEEEKKKKKKKKDVLDAILMELARKEPPKRTCLVMSSQHAKQVVSPILAGMSAGSPHHTAAHSIRISCP